MQVLRPEPNARAQWLRQEVAQTEASLLQELQSAKENFSLEKIVGELKKLVPQWVYRPVFLGAIIGLLSVSLLIRLLFPVRPKIILPSPYPPLAPPEGSLATPASGAMIAPPPAPRGSFLWELLKTTLQTVVLHLVKTRLVQLIDKWSFRAAAASEPLS